MTDTPRIIRPGQAPKAVQVNYRLRRLEEAFDRLDGAMRAVVPALKLQSDGQQALTCWLRAIERLLINKGLVDASDIESLEQCSEELLKEERSREQDETQAG